MLRTETLVALNPKVVRQGIFFLSWRNVRSDIEWSANAVDLAQTPKWRALEDHFVHGVAWEETGIIDEVLYLRQTKERGLRRPRGRQCVVRRYEALDAVYSEIRDYGYRSDASSPPRLARDRDGRHYFVGNGWHRLWMAQHFDVVEVTFRLRWVQR